MILTVANECLLVPFFTYKQRKLLIREMDTVTLLSIQMNDPWEIGLPPAAREKLAAISDRNHFEVEIYLDNGQILYTSSGSQMMDYAGMSGQFQMQHDAFRVKKREVLSDGTVIETARRRFGNREEYLLCRRQLNQNMFAEIRVEQQLIVSSAKTANELIFYIGLGCFLLSLVWVFVFARRFSRPIAEMNRITKNLSALDFTQKVTVRGSDEIAQLGGSVNEMSDSLAAALSELRQANAKLKDEIELERQLDRMRRDFVANVSHELKTPISIISGYAEGLKLNINEDAREEYCNTILDESRRMNGLVLKILELSRYESGRIEVHAERFDLSALAKQMTQRILKDCGVETAVTVPAGITVEADPMLAEQVLQAYLENARSHTPNGGSVTVTAAEIDGKIRLSVINTGDPIPAEQMPQIWQSFYRGDDSHKRDQSRFGLGLSIVSAIARLHRTACGVMNTENGVCFWFEFDGAEIRS